MKVQALTKIQDLMVYEPILKNKEKNPTYVMQGKTHEKALDVYHLIIAPTYACNLRCRHCYLPDHAQDLLPKKVVLRVMDEWNQIVSEERGKYGGIFHIKGGEPFVVPYLWDIVDRLKELQSLRLMLTTNGTFVNEQIFKKLMDCKEALDGHVTVIVSLDGATEETDAKIRGKGHFGKASRFIEGLKEYGINFYLNCVIHKENINEISAYMTLAKEYGATQVNFLNLIPRGKGSELRNWQVKHIEGYKKLERIYKEGDDTIKKMLSGSLPDIKHRELLEGRMPSSECVAAYRGLLYIIPNSSAFTCPNIVFPNTDLGNVLSQSLKEILDNIIRLYNRVKVHSGAYLCAGEKELYEMEGDMSRLKSLHSLQDNIDKSCLPYKLNSSPVSYCFNRNW